MKHQSTRKLRWPLPVALLAIMASSGLWYWQAPDSEPRPDPAETFASAPAVTPPAVTQASAPVPSNKEPPHQTPASLPDQNFARSLAGTDIDGALKADGNGELILDLGVRDFFDYFLSAVGEVSPEAAIGQIQSLARNYLPEPAASDAMVLLDQYLAYKQAALQLMQTELDPSRQHDPGYQLTALGDALSSLKQLRRSTFSPDAHQAFFGEEEAYSEYTLAAMSIQQREDLSDQGKQALIEWHRTQLPESLQATEQRLQSETREHQARLSALENTESPEAAGRKLVELGMDPESAEGVVSYLKQRESFDQQFSEFEQAVDAEDLEGLAGADRQKHKDALLEQYFPDEQSRTWARLRMLNQS